MATTDEAEVRGRLTAEGLAPSSWANGPHDRYGAHEHGYDKVIVVVAGSIRFGSRATDGAFDLGAGDRLELPAGTVHDAVVGPDGVTCLEAHVPPGTFAAPAMRPAGSW
jgi:quercetin dioxygenase-like cupin family protein